MVVGCGLYIDDAEATVAAVRAAGGTMASMQPCDLTKPGDSQALVNFAVRTFGRIDVLFKNAATAYFNWLETFRTRSGTAIAARKWTRCSTSRALPGLI